MHQDPVSPYPIPYTNGYTAPGSLFSKVEHMRRVNEEHDSRIFGLSKRRRKQFPAIATVIDALLATVPNIGTVTFCGGSNRQVYRHFLRASILTHHFGLRILVL
ncbi:hypothetical protein LB505_011286 [Fusarium chuoi]|nr:hypothetical protein LB505_011286 [Fusarium chuoi]